MALQIEMVGEMIHIKCEGEKGQFYAPLSQAEYEAVEAIRRQGEMKDFAALPEEKLTISSNQKAVEDIAKLTAYLKAQNINFESDPVNNVIRCLEHRLDIIKAINSSSMNGYQEAASKTAIYPGKGTALGLIYCTLKLTGEAGEVSENVGKALRDDGLGVAKPLTKERANKLVLELGDVLWYVSQTAKELGYTLEEIAQENLKKLTGRQERGTLQGSGDER